MPLGARLARGALLRGTPRRGVLDPFRSRLAILADHASAVSAEPGVLPPTVMFPHSVPTLTHAVTIEAPVKPARVVRGMH